MNRTPENASASGKTLNPPALSALPLWPTHSQVIRCACGAHHSSDGCSARSLAIALTQPNHSSLHSTTRSAPVGAPRVAIFSWLRVPVTAALSRPLYRVLTHCLFYRGLAAAHVLCARLRALSAPNNSGAEPRSLSPSPSSGSPVYGLVHTRGRLAPY